MREILFRGKGLRRFHYGMLIEVRDYKNQNQGCAIVENGNELIVDEKTIGQFTEMTDKNGEKIFEGDVVSDEDGNNLYVVWDKYKWSYYSCWDRDDYWCDIDEVEVSIIGNIHDNPELLEI